MPTTTITITPSFSIGSGTQRSFDLSIPLHTYFAVQWFAGSYDGVSTVDLTIEPMQDWSNTYGRYLDLSTNVTEGGHNCFSAVDVDDSARWMNLHAGGTATWWLQSWADSISVDFIRVVLTYATDTLDPGVPCHAATFNNLLAVSWRDDHNNNCLAIHPSPLSHIGTGSVGWRNTTLALGLNPGSATVNTTSYFPLTSGGVGTVHAPHLADSNATTTTVTDSFMACRSYDGVWWGYDGSLWWGNTRYAPDINSLPSGALTYSISGGAIVAANVTTQPSLSGQTKPPVSGDHPHYSGRTAFLGWYYGGTTVHQTGLFPTDGGLVSDVTLSIYLTEGQGVAYQSTTWGSGTYSSAAQLETLPYYLTSGYTEYGSTCALLFSRRDGSIYWKTRDMVGGNDTWLDNTTANLQNPGTATSGEGLVVGLTYLTSHTLVALLWDSQGTKNVYPFLSYNGGVSWTTKATIGVFDVPPYLTSIHNIPIAAYISGGNPTFLSSVDGGITWS